MCQHYIFQHTCNCKYTETSSCNRHHAVVFPRTYNLLVCPTTCPACFRAWLVPFTRGPQTPVLSPSAELLYRNSAASAYNAVLYGTHFLRNILSLQRIHDLSPVFLEAPLALCRLTQPDVTYLSAGVPELIAISLAVNDTCGPRDPLAFHLSRAVLQLLELVQYNTFASVLSPTNPQNLPNLLTLSPKFNRANDTICPCCYELYTAVLPAWTMPCSTLHSLCRICALQVLAPWKDGGGEAKCPSCRAAFGPSRYYVDELELMQPWWMKVLWEEM